MPQILQVYARGLAKNASNLLFYFQDFHQDAGSTTLECSFFGGSDFGSEILPIF